MRAIHDEISNVRRYQMRHRQAGKCSHCPNDRAPGKTRCTECLQAARQAYYDRKEIRSSLPAQAGEESAAPVTGQFQAPAGSPEVCP